MLDVLIKGGTVVSPFDIFKADIGVKDGKIATVSKTSDENADRIVSANGKLVFAGAIDAHTNVMPRPCKCGSTPSKWSATNEQPVQPWRSGVSRAPKPNMKW